MTNETDEFAHIKEENFGSGSGIAYGFKDLDEFYRYLARKEQQANERMLDIQRRMITCEDEQWYVNISVPMQELFIAGEAWSLRHARQSELESYGVETVSGLNDEQKAEFNASIRLMRDARNRGYIFGKSYSIIEPRGELGSTHVSCMWPINEAAFNEAREQMWRPDLLSNEASPNLRRALYRAFVMLRGGR